MEHQVNKGQETIQFIENLVEIGIDHKDPLGNVNVLEI